MSATHPAPPEVVYPDSDGQPMADNTLQFEWIVTIKEGLEALFRDDPGVFVAGDLLWYPVEGDPKTCAAPDALVASGRPKGYRGSYKQWEEGGIAPQVVFEVLSPNNTGPEMARKLAFYDRFGVEEYYLYDPDHNRLSGWRRGGAGLGAIPEIDGWVSPRLGIRFELDHETLHITGPDGEPFVTYVDLVRQRDAERRRAEDERRRAETERRRARRAQQQAQAAQQQAEAERLRVERLMAQLRAAGLEPEA